jgi:hypothetical protein
MRTVNEPSTPEPVRDMGIKCCQAAVGACAAPSSRRASTAGTLGGGGGGHSGPLPPFPPSALPSALLQQLGQLQRTGGAALRAEGAALLAAALLKVGPKALDDRRAQLVMEGAQAALQRPDAAPADYAAAAAALGSCLATKRPHAALNAARLCVALARSGLAAAAVQGGSGRGGGGAASAASAASSRACAELLLANSVLQALAQHHAAPQLLERQLQLPAEVPGLKLQEPGQLQATAQQLGTAAQESKAAPLLRQARAKSGDAASWADGLVSELERLPAFAGAFTRDDLLAAPFSAAAPAAAEAAAGGGGGSRAPSPAPHSRHLQASPRVQARRELHRDVIRVVDLLGDSDDAGSGAAGEAAVAAGGAGDLLPGGLQLGDLLQLADRALLAGGK